jgi:hypothetical protein
MLEERGTKITKKALKLVMGWSGWILEESKGDRGGRQIHHSHCSSTYCKTIQYILDIARNMNTPRVRENRKYSKKAMSTAITKI